jgi:hypothetical protein
MTSQNKNATITQPERVLFYGRTLQEYVKMFDLEFTTWKGCKILDCPAGPASFVEEASQQGFDVIGCDPFYIDELQLMIDYGNLDIDTTINVCSAYPQFLSQKNYSSLEELKEYAKSALKIFAESYSARRKENRYIKAALPNLPFDNKSFDLVLCGNFLFIYSQLSNQNLEQLDYKFHHQAVLELLRVSKKEVRIFPIPRWEGKLHEYAAKLLIDLEKQDIVAEILPVEYEILQGGNLMLRLTH